MTMLREAPDELFALCGAAAARLGIPDPAFVEKDFWVVELLRSVVRPIDLAPVGDVPCSAAVRLRRYEPVQGIRHHGASGMLTLVECQAGCTAGDGHSRWHLAGTQHRTITSYIADYLVAVGIDADYQELNPVHVDVIAPVRTLAEKLALLHHAGVQATRTSTQALQRAGRHFFDVYQLLGSADVISALSAPGQAMEVLAADVDAKSAEFGWDHTPAPA